MLSINACDIDPVAVMCDSINDRISQWTVITTKLIIPFFETVLRAENRR
jgi:hypothetical protein